MTITDLNLILTDLTHSYLGDLSFDLTSPAGTTAKILRSTFESPSGPLGGEDNFLNTFLDGQAPTNIANGNAPYSGSFNVNHGDVTNPFSIFNGESSLGTWTLTIRDWFSSDTGTLRNWGLMFTGIDNNPGDAFEQNDAFPQATDLGTIGTENLAGLTIHKSTDVDFYRFIAQDSTHVQLDMSFAHANGNLDVLIYDSNQQVIAEGNSTTDNESIRLAVESGELYFVEVLGLGDATNEYTLNLDVPLMVGETGVVHNVTEDWTAVTLSKSFVNPVVIIGRSSLDSKLPTTYDIGKVTTDTFTIRTHDWLKDAGPSSESFNYWGVESGEHTLRDGTRFTAGTTISIDTKWTEVSFPNSFSESPVVFAQEINNVSNDAFATRINNVTSTGFEVMPQSEEVFKSVGDRHRIHWIAIATGAGAQSDGQFEAGLIADVGSNLTGFEFENTFPTAPNVFVEMQTFNESDTAIARVGRVTNNGGAVFVQEEHSFDKEDSHVAENIGYVAFDFGELYAQEPSDAASSFGTVGLPPADDTLTNSQPYESSLFAISTLDRNDTRNITADRSTQINQMTVEDKFKRKSLKSKSQSSQVMKLKGSLTFASDRFSFPIDLNSESLSKTKADSGETESKQNAAELDKFFSSIKHRLA